MRNEDFVAEKVWT